MQRPKTYIEKLKSRAAFTLAESLITVLIMLSVSLIMATGVPAAFYAVKNIILSANAEVMMSTTITMLRNEIGTADNIKLSKAEIGDTEDTAVIYYNRSMGTTSQIYLAPDAEHTDPDRTIMLERYHSAEGIPPAFRRERLLSREASVKELYITFGSVTYEDNILTFHDLKVRPESLSPDVDDRKIYASRDAVSIRTVASEKQE